MPSASAPEYDPAAEYAKGMAALQANDYKAASRAFEHVTTAAPKSDAGWLMLGAAKAGTADWKGSRRAYERALKLAPDEPTVHAGLGLALAKLKDPKANAELDWLKAKAQACAAACPDAAALKTLTSTLETAIANPAAPQAMLPSAPRTASVGDATYLQAVGLIHEKRYDQALAALGEASQALGPHPDILTYEGYVWRKKGDLVRAKDFYEQALAIAPDHMGAMEYYGELKVVSGDTAGARRMLARLETLCTYGCAQAEELRLWIDHGGEPQS